ncbi:MAG: alpha/beta hydrolase [Deltaproteobacteria bacterium]|nr:alpha/beta hydrolase [Deltaproteobacteria bacterium]
MSELRHRTLSTNGIQMHVAEAGDPGAPLVLLCHGFPESWYSWRHQLPALAAAGYHVVAPDMRGYGQTDKPEDVRAYTQLHHVGDMVGVLDALGASTATIVGHDWGAPVAWNAAALRPDRFTAVAGLSVPWAPRAPMPPTGLMKMMFGDQWFYFLYFQEPGKAERELDANAETFLRAFLYSISGDAPIERLMSMVGGPKTGTMLEHLLVPDALPPWLGAADLAFYAGEFQRTGFRGGLNWYRCADASWELTAAWADVHIGQPALFVAGDRDGVIAMMPGAVDTMKQNMPGLRDAILLPGCGHWTQQERPQEVNEALLGFLRAL